MESNLDIWLFYGILKHNGYLLSFSSSDAGFPLVNYMNSIRNAQRIQDRYWVGKRYIHLLVPNQIYREITEQTTPMTNWRTVEWEYYSWGFIEDSKRLIRREMWRGVTLAPKCGSWETWGISQLQKDLWSFMRPQLHTETFRAPGLEEEHLAEKISKDCPLERGMSLLKS